MKEATRLRQLEELRTRSKRLTKVHTDRRTYRVIDRGWAELDRIEARGEPMSYDEIAASLGISRWAVQLIEARALDKLRALASTLVDINHR